MPSLKLSDAIMLNGVSKPQGRGFASIGSVDSPCAIGGALQAVGKQIANDTGADNYTRFDNEWPWADQDTYCPECGEVERVTHVIWQLNDLHFWTRQQIAEWVARIEPAEIPANVTCDATVVRHCEDQYGELCGKKCEPGKDYCNEHYEE